MNARSNGKDAFALAAWRKILLGAAQGNFDELLEGGTMLAECDRLGFRPVCLADPAAVAARPVKIRAAYEGACASCAAHIAIDQVVYWTRGASGVQCSDCGERG